MASVQNSGISKHKNIHVFRQRARVLKEWAGAELLHLKIENDGRILSNGISVKLVIPRSRGVSLQDIDRLIPDIPQEEQKNREQYEIPGLPLWQLVIYP